MKHINIQQILDPGALSLEGVKTSKDIIKEAVDTMGMARASEAVGVVVFRGTDQVIYTGTVEFSIYKPNPEWLVQLLRDAYFQCENKACGHLDTDGSLTRFADTVTPPTRKGRSGTLVAEGHCSHCGRLTWPISKREAEKLARVKPTAKTKK